ncbi:Uncharacterized protein APZ42_013426 [Daphnia magna]|uniref:Uncharacterized protein n=1 Tax=Daphnia magna TaxID=35525 RepID=A0A0N8ACA7_9CRUS|nr:Uncharacterized protein APZ42_013426 [Daphnia magna]
MSCFPQPVLARFFARENGHHVSLFVSAAVAAWPPNMSCRRIGSTQKENALQRTNKSRNNRHTYSRPVFLSSLPVLLPFCSKFFSLCNSCAIDTVAENVLHSGLGFFV